MLKQNFVSEPRSENGNRAICSCTELVLTVISSIIFVGLFPIALAAQIMSPGSPAVYGTGNQAPLQFAGESAPVNQAFLSVGTSVLYDNNAFAEGSHGVSDEAFSFNSQLGVTRQTDHLTANLSYSPFFLVYRTLDQLDRLNHYGNLSLDYKLTPRVTVQLRDSVNYQNGTYASLIGQQILSGPYSPTALNQMVIPHTARSLSNNSGLDLAFATSGRTLVTFSGGYNLSKFGEQVAGQPLYNSNGMNGSLMFQYRVTEHTSFGILLLHQDTTYQGGEIFGSRARFQVESTALSVGSRLSPTVSVTLYGGPQYVHLTGQLSAIAALAGKFQASGGGSITKEARMTALALSVQRSVANGAGVYTTVVNTTASFGVRRRLVGQWEAGLSGGAVRIENSLFKLGNGKTDALTGAIGITRPLFRGSVFRVSYFTWHQVSRGTLPISYNLDRNQLAVGIYYQFKTFPLGR